MDILSALLNIAVPLANGFFMGLGISLAWKIVHGRK